MAKSLTQEVKDCFKDCKKRIEAADPENKNKIKQTSKMRLEGFLSCINMKVWRGRRCSDMIWTMFEEIDNM